MNRLIAGPGVFICNECVGLCAEVLDGQPTQSFPPLDGKSDDELLADMARLDSSRGQVETAVQQRVLRLRREHGDRHPAALRHLFNRMLGQPYFCVQTGQHYRPHRAFPGQIHPAQTADVG